MIKIILVGALGRMGKAVMRAAFYSKDSEIVSAVEANDNPYIGKKITDAVPESELNISVSSNLLESMSRGDVIVDFSTPMSTMESIKMARKKELPVIIGTTGFSKPQFDAIKSYTKELPILLTSNMSVGVNAMASIIGKLSNTLGENYDIAISEIHHKNKKDAPSGTALYLASSIASAQNKNLAKMLVDEKKGVREKGKISISSMRAGDIAGEHTVIFAGDNERIEITHKATDNLVFAKGALEAARWIIDQKPGLYSMMDVLDLK